MKKSIKTVVVFLFVVTATMSSYAQMKSSSSTSEDREIRIYDYSKDQEIELEVFGDTKYFELNIESNIRYGILKVELYDPTGKKQGRFSVKTIVSAEERKKMKPDQKNYMSEIVTGRINKQFSDPIAGMWKVKVFPKQASGAIKLKSNQSKM